MKRTITAVEVIVLAILLAQITTHASSAKAATVDQSGSRQKRKTLTVLLL